jgi:hypothetical protein
MAMSTVRWRVGAALLGAVLIAGCTSSGGEDADAGDSGTTLDQTQAAPGDEAAEAQGDESAEDEGEEGRSPDDEAAEEKELTEKRLDVFQAAKANGDVGAGITVVNNPAPGWNGQRLLNPDTDDWEPAVAADPKAAYVYLLTTRYGEPKTCSSHCPTPYLPLTISNDGGKTWGAQVPLCICRGAGAQYDPTIEVVPNTGDVYAAFLNADRAGGFSTVFMRSQDHGKTWTEPVHVYGNVSWTDKPEVTSSLDGRDVYVSWNGPQGGDLYVGVSHDFGESWTQQKLTDTDRYYYDYDATVLPDGTVVFSQSSEVYGQGGAVVGQVQHHAVISRDRGASWQNVVVDAVENGEPCVAEGCSADFYTGQTSVANDPTGKLAFAYEGASVSSGPQRLYVKTSSDGGRTWGSRVALSAAGENATGPRIDSAGNGVFVLWYMQTSGGDDADQWNVWFRRSVDGGVNWSSPVRLSDATSGPSYVGPTGFAEIYGDYGEIAVTNKGKTIAIWGEGDSYIGPGGSWFALEK